MAEIRKRKAATVAGVSVLTAALLLGGTFAWQSISQMALNENRASVNPGARLHDDYSGNYSKSGAKTVTDVGVKRVYVENFTDEEDKVAIIARVRLDEYMEIGASAGYKNTTVTAYENTVISKLDVDGLAHGIVEVEEDTSVAGKVTLKVTPVPYTGYTVKSLTVDGGADVKSSMSGGVYTHAVQTISDGKITPVTIEVEFEKANSTPYAYDTIEPAKSLVEKTTAGKAVTINDSANWETYVPKVNASGKLEEDTASVFRNYVTLNFGWDSSYDTTGIYYMPTFNKDKDSLSADINGTYAGGTSGQPFGDYEEYTANQTVKDYASYDDDENDVDDGNVYKKEETHTAAAIEKTKSKVISMAQWKDDYKMAPGDYWVYDTDGWAYWANLLEPETATGLFLSRNEMTGTPEDNWYYGMNVVGQFVTSEDIGSDTDAIGFYTDANKKPSNDAKTLLGILTKLNDAQTVSLESGAELDVTYLKGEAAPLSLSAQEGTWYVSDESVLTLYENDEKTAVVATAKKPGDAVITYVASNGDIALLKVSVDYATYTIEADKISDAETKGIVTYADDEKTKVTIEGYYTDTTNKIYYQVAVGDSAFYENQTIRELIINDGVSSIGNSAFRKNNLQGNLTIPGSVKEVGEFSFAYTSLSKVTLNEGVESLGRSALAAISQLEEVELPSTLKVIGRGPFYESPIQKMEIADGNEYFIVEDDSILYNREKTQLIWYSETRNATAFTIPTTVTEIKEDAFRNNSYLETVIIPDSVETIEASIFLGCSVLKNAEIPKSVTKIGDIVFEKTASLSAIQLESGNKNYIVENGILYDKTKQTLISCPGGIGSQINIPDGVTTLVDFAFHEGTFTSVVIPASLTHVPQTAFNSCKNLENVYFKGSREQWEASELAKNNILKKLNITYDFNGSTE